MEKERICSCGAIHFSIRNMCKKCRSAKAQVSRELAKNNPTERKCTCGVIHISSTGNICNACRATKMRIARKLSKENPIEKTCIKCNISFISSNAHNICPDCKSKHNKERWPEYAKTINRNTEETVAKVKIYQDFNKLNNEKWLLEICGGKSYKCSLCSFESDVKEVYDLHHIDPSIKTDVPAQLIRRANFKELYYKEKLELICKSCHREKHSGLIENRYRRLEKHGVFPICAISGQRMKWNQLEFHHIDPSTKVFNISTRMVYALTKELFREISKCVIVSAASHILIHRGKLVCPEPKYQFINIDNLHESNRKVK